MDRVGAVSKIVEDDIGGSKSCASGVAQSTTTVVDRQVSTPPQITQAGETESHTKMHSGNAPLVKQKETGPGVSPGEHTSKEVGGDNGCISDWLGGCLARQNSQRLLGVPFDHATHQCVGVEGSLPGLETTDSFLARQTCPCKDRQHVNSLSYQPSGRQQVIALPPGDQEALGVDALPSHEWPEGLLYAFPPLPLIPHVLKRVEMGHQRILLIAPKWPMRH